MGYIYKGKKEFKYEILEQRIAYANKFYTYGIRLIKKSGFYSAFESMHRTLIRFSNQQDNFSLDLDKIYLGIGVEFLLKALFLKKGYIIHQTNIGFCKVGVESEIIIDTNNMVKFEDLKNKLSQIITCTSKDIKILNLIQEWRNGIIHQVSGPEGSDSAQWQKIEKILKSLNNEFLKEE